MPLPQLAPEYRVTQTAPAVVSVSPTAERQPVAPLELAPTTRAEMYGWDWAWLEQARWTDARLCLAGQVRPYKRDCGGDPICNWGFYQVQQACSLETFQRVLFQGVRYAWCQAELQYLLANRPARRSPDLAPQWVDWTLRIMRAVSMARWATNISSDYLAAGPRTKAALKLIRGWQPGPGEPTKRADGDIYPSVNQHVLTLWAPRDLNWTRYPAGAPAIPQTEQSFDPIRNYDFNTVQRMRGDGVHATWPWRWIPQSPGTNLRAQMIAWFEQTISAGYWFKDTAALVEYPTRADCPASLAASGGVCLKQARVPFWYGTAYATVTLAEAWAQDVIERPFGRIVAESLDSFLARYQSIPPELRVGGLSNQQITDIRGALQQVATEEAFAAFASVAGTIGTIGAAINAAAGIVVAVATAVVGLLLIILQAANAMAFGGGILEAACITSPIVRSIPTGESAACDFDIRGSAAEDALRRIDAVRQTAGAGLPVDAWYDASKRASGEGDISELLRTPPPPGGVGRPWLPWLLAGGAAVGGALIIKKLRK